MLSHLISFYLAQLIIRSAVRNGFVSREVCNRQMLLSNNLHNKNSKVIKLQIHNLTNLLHELNLFFTFKLVYYHICELTFLYCILLYYHSLPSNA
jgi:hypothetical protein